MFSFYFAETQKYSVKTPMYTTQKDGSVSPETRKDPFSEFTEICKSRESID